MGYVAFYNAVDLLSVKAYDADGELIGWTHNASASWVEVDLGAAIIASVVVDDSLSTSFVLDNIVVRRESPTAGVADQASEQGMRVFPDPFQDEVHVRTGTRTARPWVTGIDGRMVPTAPPTAEEGGWRLDLHALPSGVYLVHAGGLQRPLTQRIIKR